MQSMQAGCRLLSFLHCVYHKDLAWNLRYITLRNLRSLP